MMEPNKVSCPKCGFSCAIEIEEEVDIGVGIQKFITGWDCERCGQMGACTSCGIAIGTEHRRWCDAKTPIS